MQKKTERKVQRYAKANKEKITILSKCRLCDSKKMRFIKNEEATGSLSNQVIICLFGVILL